MIHRFITAIALATAVLGAPAVAAQPITGTWLTADGGAVVAIGDCGGRLCGRITRLLKRTATGPAVDAKNPNPALRTRALIGLPVLTGIGPADDGWTAQVYDPKTGRTVRATLTRAGGKLNIRGCMGPFCRTAVWTQAG